MHIFERRARFRVSPSGTPLTGTRRPGEKGSWPKLIFSRLVTKLALTETIEPQKKYRSLESLLLGDACSSFSLFSISGPISGPMLCRKCKTHPLLGRQVPNSSSSLVAKVTAGRRLKFSDYGSQIPLLKDSSKAEDMKLSTSIVA